MAIIDLVNIDNDIKNNSLKIGFDIDGVDESIIKKNKETIFFMIKNKDGDLVTKATITEIEYRAEVNRIQTQLDLLESFATEHGIKIT